MAFDLKKLFTKTDDYEAGDSVSSLMKIESEYPISKWKGVFRSLVFKEKRKIYGVIEAAIPVITEGTGTHNIATRISNHGIVLGPKETNLKATITLTPSDNGRDPEISYKIQGPASYIAGCFITKVTPNRIEGTYYTRVPPDNGVWWVRPLDDETVKSCLIL